MQLLQKLRRVFRSAIHRSPVVSVIIPVYNDDRWIARAIRSVTSQYYRNIELIVVNDASTDHTGEILRQLHVEHSGCIKILTNTSNLGTYPSINEGILASSGDMITILGSDDTFHRDKISLQVDKLLTIPSAMASVCKYARFDALSGVQVKVRYGESTILFRKQVVDEIGYFDGVRLEGDREFMRRLLAHFGPGSIAFLGKVLYHAQQRTNSLTTNRSTGLQSELRKTYVDSYEKWHRSGARLYMPHPIGTRPFEAPGEILSQGQ